MDIYANIKSDKKRAALEYGMRLRQARGISGYTRCGFDTFTEIEISQIQDISTNAVNRAKEIYNEALRKIAADPNSGTQEEPRQYTGK